MSETYLLTSSLLCHDVRLNTSIETRVILDHYPTEKEAIQYLCVKAEEVVAHNFCEGCIYDVFNVHIELVAEQ